VPGCLRRPGCCLPQRLRAHHDPLAIGLQHQHIGVRAGARTAPGVEGAHIGGRSPGKLLSLPFAHASAGGPEDRLRGVLERAARGLDRGQPPQPVRVLFLRQVQRRIGRIQVRRPRRAVGHPGDRHLPEHRGQAPLMAGLRAGARHPVRAGHLAATLFPGRTKVQMILQQQPEHLPGVSLQLRLQPGVAQVTGRGPLQPRHHRTEPRPRLPEDAQRGIGHGGLARG
jgi:hypothetical protein